MRLSRYFMPILKENPKEAEIVSHRLMLRTGMIRQQSQGIYSWLPLGKRVLDKVNAILAAGKADGSLNTISEKWLKQPLPADL